MIGPQQNQKADGLPAFICAFLLDLQWATLSVAW
jgi:hypothetical protein